MKLATLDTGGDGTLLIVSRDLAQAVRADAAPNLQEALNRWTQVEPDLKAQSDRLNAGDEPASAVLDTASLAAVLPRSYQFLDASAFLAHNHILAKAWGIAPRTEGEPPLMYQGLSNQFFAAHQDVAFGSFDHQVDFEAELGVIVDAVPLGTAPGDALAHARLLTLINDWSLRKFGPEEMRAGFGFLHAKPPSTLSAFALTPDELGDAWRDGRVMLPLEILRGDELFGRPTGAQMHFGFGELISHAAATRDLCAGTVIGSGTVANFDAEEVGSGCIAERVALDLIGERPLTPYLAPGERIRIALRDGDGAAILGVIDQRVVAR